MRLTQHTDYALRLLMLLASDPAVVYTVEDVARRYDVSRNHLVKVAQTLAQAGFIETTRGRGGGLRLRRSPVEINLGAVVRATEDSFAVVECFDRTRNRCIIEPACGLRRVLDEALRAFLAVLDERTLADLIAEPRGLRQIRRLLAIPNANNNRRKGNP